LPVYNILGLQVYIPDVGDLVLWITDPIKNFLRQAWSFGGELSRAISEAVLGGFTTFFGDFYGFVNNLQLLVQNAVIDAAGDIWGRILNTGEDIYKILSSFAVNVEHAIGDIANGLYSFAGDAFNNVLGFLAEIEGFISTEFKFWVGEAAEYIINSLKDVNAGMGNAFGLINKAIRDTVDYISAGFGSITNQISQGLAAIDASNEAFKREFRETLLGSITGIWKGFVDDIAVPVAQIVQTGINAIGDNFMGLIQGGNTLFSQIAATFQGAWEAMIKWLTGLIMPKRDALFTDPIAYVTKSLSSILGIFGGFGVAMTAAEIAHPIKQMGFTRLAAYLNEMGDFKNIAGGLINAIQQKATLIPLEQALNLLFRPYLPDLNTGNTWMFKGIISGDEWRQIYATRGWSDDLIDRYYRDVWTEPSDRMLIALAETPGVPADWMDRKIAARGYEAVDRELFKLYITKRRLADEFSSVKSSYENAVVKGYFAMDDYADVLRKIGRNDIEIQWALFAAQIKTDAARLTEDIEEYVQAFRTGKLDAAQFKAGIFALPIVPFKAANIVEKEAARKRSTAAAEKAAKQAKLSLSEILRGYDLGLLDELTALARILVLNYTPDDANLILQIHKADIAAREADAAQNAMLQAERAAARQEQTLAIAYARYLIRAMQARLLALDVVKAEIAILPLPAGRIDLLLKEAELANAKDQDMTADARPKTLREIEVYKALNLQIITLDQAIEYLRVLGFSDEDIQIKLAINSI